MSEQRRATVAQLLAASALPERESRALLARQLNVAREHLIAHPDQVVSASDAAGFEQLALRRRANEPLAYLLGEREFYGRMFAVSPAVLIPRPETELLVDLALAHLAGCARSGRQPHVVDLGTGSGCIAISLAIENPRAEIIATDASTAALTLARANAARLGADNVEFAAGDWYAALPADARFDLIVSNPPYVAAGDPHLADLRFEPALALIAEAGGLAALRTIIEGAPSHLSPGGWLLLEHGFEQGAAVRALLEERRWINIQTHFDPAGLERVTVAGVV